MDLITRFFCSPPLIARAKSFFLSCWVFQWHKSSKASTNTATTTSSEGKWCRRHPSPHITIQKLNGQKILQWFQSVKSLIRSVCSLIRTANKCKLKQNVSPLQCKGEPRIRDTFIQYGTLDRTIKTKVKCYYYPSVLTHISLWFPCVINFFFFLPHPCSLSLLHIWQKNLGTISSPERERC